MLAPQTRLQACEYLAKIERIHQQYDKALDYLKQAANLSPRNIDRLKHVAELARLTHDYESQFEADYAIVRNAKNSIHEKPDIYLAAVRSAIDLGLASLSEDKSSQMALTGQTILASLKKTFTLKEVGEQVDVIQARIYNLKNDKQKAKQLLAHTIEELEDNLDKLNRDNVEYFLDTAKACHEIGFHQHSQKVFDALVKFAGRQTGATLFKRYLIGERALRAKIKESPKELNNRAVEYFRRGNLNGALETFEMAFKVMPKNPTIALNLMQAALENQRGSNQDMVASLVAKCVATVEKVKLNSEQTNRYEKLSELVKRQIAV
jgi:tetratricopeptide (TPR) repeat protein